MIPILEKALILFSVVADPASENSTELYLLLFFFMGIFLLQRLSRGKTPMILYIGAVLAAAVHPRLMTGLPLLLPAPFPYGLIAAAVPLFYGNFFLSLLLLLDLLFFTLYRKYTDLDALHKKVRDDYEERNLLLREALRQKNKRRLAENKILIMEERNRMSGELHDAVGHTITASLLQLEAMKVMNKDETLKQPLEDTSKALSEGMDEIRAVLRDQKRTAVDLQGEIEKILEQSPLDYDVRISGDDFDLQRKFTLITLVKEAVTNSLKHSDADRITVDIISHPGFDGLRIKDNGTKDPRPLDYGMGLMEMHEIAERSGGVLRIDYDNGFAIYMTLMKETR